MITKIGHISSGKALGAKINYNENKVEKEEGSLILDNTFSDNKEERIEAFEKVIDSNKNVKSNLAFEVCLSFPHGENITDGKFREVLDDYIKKMGYENCPYVCYRHDDKKHQHYHTIISHIDWEGKKIPQYNMFIKSLKLSRELEIKHGLKITEYRKTITNKSLSEINARKNYFSNAIINGLKSYKTKDYLIKNITRSQIEKIINNNKDKHPLTNQQVSSLLQTKAETVRNYLSENGMFNSFLKDELYNKVESAFKKSVNKAEFITNLDKENIYVRKLYNSNRTPYFIYGLKDMSFYVKDSYLAKKFTFNNLYETKNEDIQIGKSSHSFDIKEQKNFIKINSSRVLKECRSLKEFAEKLNEKGIELITYENKRGIYGVAFKSINIENPEIIKGSEVGLSWQDVNLKINLNSQVSVKEIIVEDIPKDIDIEENNYYLPYIPGNAIHIKGQESEDFSTLKKKKKGKGQGRSKENNRGRGM